MLTVPDVEKSSILKRFFKIFSKQSKKEIYAPSSYGLLKNSFTYSPSGNYLAIAAGAPDDIHLKGKAYQLVILNCNSAAVKPTLKARTVCFIDKVTWDKDEKGLSTTTSGSCLYMPTEMSIKFGNQNPLP